MQGFPWLKNFFSQHFSQLDFFVAKFQKLQPKFQPSIWDRLVKVQGCKNTNNYNMKLKYIYYYNHPFKILYITEYKFITKNIYRYAQIQIYIHQCNNHTFILHNRISVYTYIISTCSVHIVYKISTFSLYSRYSFLSTYFNLCKT